RNNAPDARHHVATVEFHAHVAQAKRARSLCFVHELRSPNQSLGRNAAEVEAVAAHPPAFHERDFGPGDCPDIGGDETGGASADHDQIAVETARLYPAPVDLACLDPVQ